MRDLLEDTKRVLLEYYGYFPQSDNPAFSKAQKGKVSSINDDNAIISSGGRRLQVPLSQLPEEYRQVGATVPVTPEAIREFG